MGYNKIELNKGKIHKICKIIEWNIMENKPGNKIGIEGDIK